jgi:hypothetical protein
MGNVHPFKRSQVLILKGGLVADARLEIKAGDASFTGEGTEEWLAKQLDKVLEKLPQLAELHQNKAQPDKTGAAEGGLPEKQTSEKIGSLVAYLKEKKATTSQSRKFLATAAWLQSGGMDRITTAEVTKTLNTHKQGKLSNPSQCLVHNTTSGNIVKDGKRQFYVTAEGLEELDK